MYEFLSVQIYHDASKSSQGNTLLEKFKPEDKQIKTYYRAQLKLLQRVKFRLRTILRGTIPRPIKDILNKFIAWIRKLI